MPEAALADARRSNRARCAEAQVDDHSSLSSPQPTPDPFTRARELVACELEEVNSRLEELLESQRDYLTDAELGFYRGGKRLRPLLMLLSAHLASRPQERALTAKAIAAAVSLELTHVGSLIHDDIVDRAPMRRGLPTITASRGYELALVIGDLQWVQATRTMAAHLQTREDIVLMRDFLESGEQTCRGQLDEMLSRPLDDRTELVRRYYRTIDRKTGRLISFACEGGARLVEGTPSVVGGLRRYGSWLGRAFQIVDDVLDIVRPSAMAGKEALTDLRCGRLSLPLIYALDDLPADHPLARTLAGERLAEPDAAEALRSVIHGQGWMRALGDARAIVQRALDELSLLPSGTYRDALAELALHTAAQGFLTSDDPADTA
jgi:heptaprenyl diphosphate synthase